jgi:sigma-B regulation protein RsbU (phosphoserine phosphatase)
VSKNLNQVWVAEKKSHELSVQNERLRVAAIERDLELASQVQESLVTQFDPFQWHGLKVEYYQKKFDKLGGDWFGARILSSGELVLAVTDVSGKGVAAAMVAQAIHTLWVATLFEEGFSPESFLHSANKTLLMMGVKVPHTATMGIAVVSDDTVKYYSAGHVPLVLDYGVDAAKRFIPVIATGSILGMSPVLGLSVKQMAISAAQPKGILIGTDGIFHGGTSLRQKGLGQLLDRLDESGSDALESYGAADDKLLIWAKRAA